MLALHILVNFLCHVQKNKRNTQTHEATHRIRELFERSTYGLHFEGILSFILLEIKNKRVICAQHSYYKNLHTSNINFVLLCKIRNSINKRNSRNCQKKLTLTVKQSV